MVITLTFNNALNISLTIGDTVLYAETNPSGGYSTSSLMNTTRLGTVTGIDRDTNTIEVTNTSTNVAPILNINQTYFMFTKDNKTNLTSLTGYYAEAKFVNDSKEKAELFAVGSEVTSSSK